MADSHSSNAASGIGFFGLLTLIFVVLKLVGAHFATPVAHWSWWLVFSPMILGTVFWIVIVVAIFVIAIIASK